MFEVLITLMLLAPSELVGTFFSISLRGSPLGYNVHVSFFSATLRVSFRSLARLFATLDFHNAELWVGVCVGKRGGIHGQRTVRQGNRSAVKLRRE